MESKSLKQFGAFDITKSDASNIVKNTIEQIENGEVSALDIIATIKKFEFLFSALTSTDEKKNKKNAEYAKKFKSFLDDEIAKFEKSFEYKGFDVTKKESGVKWHYENCNDDILLAMESKLSELQKEIKARQEFLKTLPAEGLSVVDEDNGEVSTIYPPYKTSTTTANFTLKNE